MSKPIELREADFKREVFSHVSYPVKTLEAFYNYWSEPNKGNSKMRFELEKTWHTGRRLGTWLKNESVFDKSFNGTGQAKLLAKKKKEFTGLDGFLDRYKNHPTGIKFEEFGKYYDQMKLDNLLCQMDKTMVDHLLEI